MFKWFIQNNSVWTETNPILQGIDEEYSINFDKVCSKRS